MIANVITSHKHCQAIAPATAEKWQFKPTHFQPLWHQAAKTRLLYLPGTKLGGSNGETIDLEGVCQMVVEVLDGALASDDGLDEETEGGEHGETAILDLLDLQVDFKHQQSCDL